MQRELGQGIKENEVGLVQHLVLCTPSIVVVMAVSVFTSSSQETKNLNVSSNAL